MYWYVGGYVLCILLAWGGMVIDDRVNKSRGHEGWDGPTAFWMGILWPLVLVLLVLSLFVVTWARFTNYVAYRISEKVKQELGVNE